RPRDRMRINTVIEAINVGLQDVSPPQSGVLRKFMACSLRPFAVDGAPRRLEIRCCCGQAGSADIRGYGSPVLHYFRAQEEVMDRIADTQGTPEQASSSEGVYTRLPTWNPLRACLLSKISKQRDTGCDTFRKRCGHEWPW